jgi:hypothetical protein
MSDRAKLLQGHYRYMGLYFDKYSSQIEFKNILF